MPWLCRLKTYKKRQEGRGGGGQIGHSGTAHLLEDTGLREFIRQSLDAEEDSEDDLHWDEDEATFQDPNELKGCVSFAPVSDLLHSHLAII